MTGVSRRVWVLLAVLSVGDIGWCEAHGMSLSHWWPLVVVGAGLLAVSAVSRRNGARPLVGMISEWTLLWIIFSVAGALLTYLAAAHNGPLYDADIAGIDRALGFDWTAWYHFVAGRPWLELPLAITYHSLLPQILLSVFWFCAIGCEYRNAELLTNVTIALLLTTAIFSLFPTLGPCVGVPAFREAYVEDLIGLRNGTLPSLNIMLLKGVIAFPSFHAVLATLFTYAHRGSPIFWPVAAFNAIMLVALPSEGGHYMTDVFGGIAVGIVALLATRVLPARVPVLAPARIV